MSQLVAVYGSLREGFGNHSLLEDSKLLGVEVLEPRYTMLDLGAFPGVLLEGESPITVEIYEVDADTFLKLDQLEGYPSFYNRTQIRTDKGQAWMYFLEGSEWSTVCVPSGDWADKFKREW